LNVRLYLRQHLHRTGLRRVFAFATRQEGGDAGDILQGRREREPHRLYVGICIRVYIERPFQYLPDFRELCEVPKLQCIF
jgi:hypothetical protein